MAEKPPMGHQCHRCLKFVPDEELRLLELPVTKDGVPTGERAMFFVHRERCPVETPQL